MVIFQYTHAFTLQQLQLILTQYLELGPYFQCLKKILIIYTQRFQSIPLAQRHNQQKQHIIRLPTNCSNYKSKQLANVDLDTFTGNKCFIYPLTTIIEILNTNQFYLELPKNIIINGLLTTTNINIIIKTLTIVSQELSKLIKSTLNSYEEKQLTSYINTLVNDCLDQNSNQDEDAQHVSIKGSQKRISFKDLGFLGLLFQKGLNMFGNQDKKQNQQQKNKKQKYLTTQNDIGTIKIDSVMQMSQVQTNQKIQSFNNLFKPQKNKRLQRKSSRASIIASILSSSDLNKNQTKNVVRTLKTLLGEQKLFKTVNLISSKDIKDSKDKNQHSQQFITKPKTFQQCQYCRNYRNYLLQSIGLYYFDINLINKISPDTFFILKRIKSVVNSFTLYLKETNQTTVPANINVINKILSTIGLTITQKIWEDTKLNPKYQSKENSTNKKWPSKSSSKSTNLLTQLQPYYKQVYNYQAYSQNQYSIDELLRMCLKATDQKQIEKQLAQKYMSQTRSKKEGKDIQTFCITKQVLNNKINIPLNQRIQQKLQFTTCQQKKFVNQIQLLRQYQKQQQIINRAKLNSKPVYTQINQKYQEQVSLNNALNRYKQNTMYNKSNKKTMQASQNNLKQYKKINDVHENQKFKILIYHQYMKRQGFNVTKNNMSNIINQNVMKISKSMKAEKVDRQKDDSIIEFQNGNTIDNQFLSSSPNQLSNNMSYFPNNYTNNSLSNLKTEQDNNDFEKKQTEIYNKMLLNGQTIRNQVLNQVEYGDAIIYESYEDFMKKLENMKKQLEEEEESEQNDEKQQNQLLFLTSMGKTNLKKTQSFKKSISREQSLNNSRRCQLNMRKTQFKKLNIRQTNLGCTTSCKSRQKRKAFDDIGNTQNGSKKQIKFKKQLFQKEIFINGSFINEYNQNLEIKKPQWLNQYLDSSQKNQNQKNNHQNTKSLMQNQRFALYKQKLQLQQNLREDMKRSQTLNKTSKQISLIQSRNKNKQSITRSSTAKQLKRPYTACIRSPPPTNQTQNYSKKGTIKSMCKTLNGKKRSFLLNKQFVINNNSLLTKLYKQNYDDNVFVDVRKQIRNQKSMNELKFKIQKSKFRFDDVVVMG